MHGRSMRNAEREGDHVEQQSALFIGVRVAWILLHSIQDRCFAWIRAGGKKESMFKVPEGVNSKVRCLGKPRGVPVP